MKKKQKFQPLIITSKEALTFAINDVVRAKLLAAAINVEMETEIAEIQKKYQSRLEPVLRKIATHEAAIQTFTEQHREELLPEGMKSLDFQLATIGFRDTPHRVEKVRRSDTFDEIALRLASYKEFAEQDGKTTVVFNGEDYIRYADPELDKKALLADRTAIPASALKAVGLKFEQDELFYLEPKSQVIEGTTEVAAA